MHNNNYMQEILRDILSTHEYTLSGIAIHTQIPEDVLSDLAVGINNDLTFESARKIFELHISVRQNLYNEIMQKIVVEYLTSNLNNNSN